MSNFYSPLPNSFSDSSSVDEKVPNLHLSLKGGVFCGRVVVAQSTCLVF